LGTPAEGRQAARKGDVEALWRVYDWHNKTPDAQVQLEELVSVVRAGGRVCLLCFERDPQHCHRSRIAELVGDRMRVRVDNLAPPLF
ncbi:MAG: DUF488 family protein, partial [Pseudorhodoplanes sp.]